MGWINALGIFAILGFILISAYIGFHILAYYSHSDERPVEGKQYIRFCIVGGVVLSLFMLICLPIDMLSNVTK